MFACSDVVAQRNSRKVSGCIRSDDFSRSVPTVAGVMGREAREIASRNADDRQSACFTALDEVASKPRFAFTGAQRPQRDDGADDNDGS